MSDAPHDAPQAERPETGEASPQGRSGRTILEGRGLRKEYVGGDGRNIVVLDGVEIEVRAGEVVAIVGASGAGKSTLLQILGGLDRPSSGEVRVGNRNLSTLTGDQLADARSRSIGFVFQFHHLLREFTAVENVMMPLLIADVPPARARDRAREILIDVGLGERLENKPTQLSGGEQQRVAVARALADDPELLLADEPSGNLDAHTSEELHELFFRLSSERGVGMILVTHNLELANRADRLLLLKEGRLRTSYPE